VRKTKRRTARIIEIAVGAENRKSRGEKSGECEYQILAAIRGKV